MCSAPKMMFEELLWRRISKRKPPRLINGRSSIDYYLGNLSGDIQDGIVSGFAKLADWIEKSEEEGMGK